MCVAEGCSAVVSVRPRLLTVMSDRPLCPSLQKNLPAGGGRWRHLAARRRRSRPRAMSLSKAERAFVRDGIERTSAWTVARAMTTEAIFELGVVPQASGSARLRLGATDVMVAVKADIASAAARIPTTVDCSVRWSSRDTRTPRTRAEARESLGVERRQVARAESARRVGGLRVLPPPPAASSASAPPRAPRRAGAALDMSQLCIQRGKTCWLLQCDALVLNADGSVLDALSVAARAALADARVLQECAAVADQPRRPPSSSSTTTRSAAAWTSPASRSSSRSPASARTPSWTPPGRARRRRAPSPWAEDGVRKPAARRARWGHRPGTSSLVPMKTAKTSAQETHSRRGRAARRGERRGGHAVYQDARASSSARSEERADDGAVVVIGGA